MARALTPVSVAGIEFDALIEEQRQLDAEIPQYTTEEGFKVSDAIIIDPETISMTLFVTDTPVTWRGRHPGQHADAVCARLESVYFAKEPITITTSDARYTMMGIQSITFQKSTEIGYSKEIPVTFKKIRKTYLASIAGLPESYGSGGNSGESAGMANTSEGNDSGSTLLAVFDGLANNVLSKGLGNLVAKNS